ncbi:MAG: hypothetical protein K2L48_00865, partial [Mycoplasmoidaceae bacterium]|nr:hypothetical protein [Mycoplasmoidaceae bacterium]
KNKIIKKFINESKKIKNYQPKNGKRYYEDVRNEKKVLNRQKKAAKRQGYNSFAKKFSTEENLVPNEFLNKIICNDCLSVLKTMPSNCVDAIITSPPYNFGIDYALHNDAQKWKDYFNKLNDIFKEWVRVLKYGGRIIINIQPLYSDSIPTHTIISNMLFNLGLIWKTEII